MSENTVDNIELIKISDLNLNSAQIGTDINSRFKNIDDNFRQIINSEYLKGAKGDSVFVKKIQLSSEPITGERYSIYETFIKLISGCNTIEDAKDIYGNLTRFDSLLHEDQFVSIVYEKVDNDLKQISILPFVFKDEKFDVNKKSENNEDLSCIICYQDDKYVKIQNFPTLYYNPAKGRMCWKINGIKTELIAEGVQGIQGINGSGVYITKHKTVDDVKKITEIYYYNLASENNEFSWFSIDNKEFKNPLVDGCIVFSIDSDSPNIMEWEVGLISTKTENYLGEYILINNDDKINNIIGTKGANLLSLMKDNKYIYIWFVATGSETASSAVQS